MGFPVAAAAASLEGAVTDAERGEAMVGAMVEVAGRRAQTDMEGRYRLEDLPIGEQTLSIQALGYETHREPIPLADGVNRKDVSLSLGITVQAREYTVKGRRPLLKKEPVVSSVSLEGRSIRKQAGNLEEISRAVQALPGVALEGDFLAVVYIRGGTPAETQFLIDEAVLANPYHFGGLNTIINPELVDSIEFYSGAFPARYANVSAGIIDTRYIEGSAPLDGVLDLSLITAKLQVNDATRDGRFKYVIAGRRTYFDGILTGMDAAGLIEKEKTVVPAYSDWLGKFTWQPAEQHKLILTILLADDSAVIGELEDNTRPEAKPGRVDYENFIEVGGIQYRWAPNRRFYGTLLYNVFAEQSRGELTGTNPFSFEANAEIQQAKAEWGWLPDRHRIEGGLLYNTIFIKLKGLLRDFSSLARAGNYGGADPNLPLLDVHPSDRSNLYGVFLQDEIEIVPEILRANLGARADYWEVDRSWLASPRFSIAYNLLKETVLKAGGGLYYQGTPNPLRRIEAFNSPENPARRSTHYVLGVEQGFGNDAFFRLEGYYKWLDRQPTNYDEAATASQAFIRGDPLFGSDGVGYSTGIEAFFQRRESEDHAWDGSLAYTYAVARYKNTWAVRFDPWYYPRQDQRHMLSATAILRPWDRWSFSGRFQFFSGRPITPITGWAVEDDRSDPDSGAKVWVPTYGALNSARLPTYHRLDARLERRWDAPSSKVYFYFEILNLYNKKNLYLYEYKEGDVAAGREPRQKPIHQLPILPYLGFRAEF